MPLHWRWSLQHLYCDFSTQHWKPSSRKENSFIFFLCVCMSVSLFVCTPTHGYIAYKHKKVRGGIKCLPLSLLHLMVLRQCLSLSLELTDSAKQASHWAPGNLPCFCPALGLQRWIADSASSMGAEGRTQILQHCGEQETSWADFQLQEYSLISFDLSNPFHGDWWLRWPFPDSSKMGPDDHGGHPRQRK